MNVSTDASPAVPNHQSPATSYAIKAEGLVKTNGAVKALDGFSFDVGAGEVFGLLGPNGAGKSTTIKILTTLSSPTAGRATVAGRDVTGEGDAVRAGARQEPDVIHPGIRR